MTKKRVHLRIADVAADTDQLAHVAIEDLMPLPGATWEEKDWTPITDATKATPTPAAVDKTSSSSSGGLGCG